MSTEILTNGTLPKKSRTGAHNVLPQPDADFYHLTDIISEDDVVEALYQKAWQQKSFHEKSILAWVTVCPKQDL